MNTINTSTLSTLATINFSLIEIAAMLRAFQLASTSELLELLDGLEEITIAA